MDRELQDLTPFTDQLEIFESPVETIEKALVKAALLFMDIAEAMPQAAPRVLRLLTDALESLLFSDTIGKVLECDKGLSSIIKALASVVANDELDRIRAEEFNWRKRNIYLAVQCAMLDRLMGARESTPSDAMIEKELRCALDVLTDIAASRIRGGPEIMCLFTRVLRTLLSTSKAERDFNKLEREMKSSDMGYPSQGLADEHLRRMRGVYVIMRDSVRFRDQFDRPH